MAQYFVIVGANDKPLFQLEFGSTARGPDSQEHMNQFIVHAALDSVAAQLPASRDMYLKTVDKFNNLNVNAFVTNTQTKFMLLHQLRQDDTIRSFFSDVYELYIKLVLSPFFNPANPQPITSQAFRDKVVQLSKRLA
eukprot:m.186159 g.186159  ORF g.186159 m.186159 type:complete len:137 (-) comp14750_c0_seq4:2484-2894(-)